MSEVYTLEQYVALDDTEILRQRFDSLELLHRVLNGHYEELQQILANPEYAAKKIQWYKVHLEEYERGMKNILQAIACLDQPDEDEEIEYEDDDE